MMSVGLNTAIAAMVFCFSQVSAQVSLVVLLADPGNKLVGGETLNLTCRVITDGSHPELTYEIWRGNITVSATLQIQAQTHSLLIREVSIEHSGNYKCIVILPDGEQRESVALQVTVEDVLLKPMLTVSPPDGRAYVEDTVRLWCGLHKYHGWKYFWYRGSRNTYPLEQTWDGGGGEAVLRLWRTRLSDTGQYWCRAGRGTPIFYTNYSDSVYVNITNFFSRVTLSLSPGLGLKDSKPFSFTCDAQLSEREAQKAQNSSRRAQVTYTFCKNGQAFISRSPHAMVTMTQAQRCDSGRYSCTAVSGRAQQSSPELHISTDDTSLVLVVLVGTALIIVVILVPFIIREFFIHRVVSTTMTCLPCVMTQAAGRESAYQADPV